jgi:hypothetical protein
MVDGRLKREPTLTGRSSEASQADGDASVLDEPDRSKAGKGPHPDGIVGYTAHQLRHVCAPLLIASGASDVQVAHQMGHAKIETTKNIYGQLFTADRAAILEAMNQAVSCLYAYEEDPSESGGRRPPDPG